MLLRLFPLVLASPTLAFLHDFDVVIRGVRGLLLGRLDAVAAATRRVPAAVFRFRQILRVTRRIDLCVLIATILALMPTVQCIVVLIFAGVVLAFDHDDIVLRRLNFGRILLLLDR